MSLTASPVASNDLPSSSRNANTSGADADSAGWEDGADPRTACLLTTYSEGWSHIEATSAVTRVDTDSAATHKLALMNLGQTPHIALNRAMSTLALNLASRFEVRAGREPLFLVDT